MPPCSTVVHIISRQSLLFDIILYFVQPSSLLSSSLPSPLFLHFLRPSSCILFLSSHHMPIPLQPSLLDFLCDFPHFRCPSYSFISNLVQLRNSTYPYRSILIYATSNFFPVPSSTPMSLPSTSVMGLPLFCTPSPWYSRSFSCRTTLQILSSRSYIRSALWVTSASGSPSLKRGYIEFGVVWVDSAIVVCIDSAILQFC